MSGGRLHATQKAESRLAVKARRFLSMMKDQKRNDSEGDSTPSTSGETSAIRPIGFGSYETIRWNATTFIGAECNENKTSSEKIRSVIADNQRHLPTFNFTSIKEQDWKSSIASEGDRMSLFPSTNVQGHRMGATGAFGMRHIPKPTKVTFGTVKIQRFGTFEGEESPDTLEGQREALCKHQGPLSLVETKMDSAQNQTLKGRKDIQESQLTVDEFESHRTLSRMRRKKNGSRIKVNIKETRKCTRSFQKIKRKKGKKPHMLAIEHFISKIQSHLEEGGDEK